MSSASCPLSSCPHVPLSSGPSCPLSSCPHVPLSPRPSVLMYSRPSVLTSLCPHVPPQAHEEPPAPWSPHPARPWISGPGPGALLTPCCTPHIRVGPDGVSSVEGVKHRLQTSLMLGGYNRMGHPTPNICRLLHHFHATHLFSFPHLSTSSGL